MGIRQVVETAVATLYRDVLASSYPVDGITPEKAIEQPGVDVVEAVELATDAVRED